MVINWDTMVWVFPALWHGQPKTSLTRFDNHYRLESCVIIIATVFLTVWVVWCKCLIYIDVVYLSRYLFSFLVDLQQAYHAIAVSRQMKLLALNSSRASAERQQQAAAGGSSTSRENSCDRSKAAQNAADGEAVSPPKIVTPHIWI